MKEKIMHHPLLTGFSLSGLIYIITLITAIVVSPLWWSLAALALFVYFYTFIWHERYVLVCPNCGYSPWAKTAYFCSSCGTRLVFKGKQKVKPEEKVKPDKVPEPTCSKGHRVFAFDKYCGKCGEKLQQ